MPEKERTVIVNTTPLISLAIIGKFDLLKKIYTKVFIPKAVHQEILAGGEESPGFKELQSARWVKIAEISDEKAREFLLLELDEGESEVIILAEEKKADLVILDDHLARSIAELRGLKITGTLGVLIKAKKLGFILEIKSLIGTLRKNGIWISDRVYEIVLKEAGEF
ncbi:MAG: DUF3368 domain-containing protein [candidate division KSB1 bacterium]|nr:DUF3368 domain-containing protein [candidate division KSB1 bacterium]